MTEHATLAPSNAAIWSRCEGQPLMLGQVPEQLDTEASAEGTLVHEAGANILDTGRPGAVELTDEQFAHAEAYAHAVYSIIPEEVPLHVEETLKPGTIHVNCWGTPDVWGYDTQTGTLYIIDLKYGRLPQEVFESLQHTCYYDCVVTNNPAIEMTEALDLLKVEYHIYQPRAHDGAPALRSWKTTGTALRGIVNMLHGAAERAENAKSVTAGAHCGHCPAKSQCDANKSAAGYVVSCTADAIARILEPSELGNELASLQDAAALLRKRIEALTVEAETRIDQGEHVAGFHMGRGRGSTFWPEANRQAVLDTARLFDIDMIKGTLYTPTQAKARGIPAAIVDSLSDSKPGAAKLTRSKASDAQKVFT